MNNIEKPWEWKGITRRHLDKRAIIGEFGERIVKEYMEGLGLRIQKQEWRSSNLPDYRLGNSEVFIEVKSHKSKRPSVWQKPVFSMMAKMGWKIYVAQPRVKIDRNGRKMSCRSIEWYLFMDSGKLIRMRRSPFEKDIAG